MQTLGTAATPEAPGAQALPDVFPPLSAAGIRPRRGTVTMLAAQSANMKTALALYWVARMGVPTMFFSADTDAATIAERSLAMITGATQDDARRDIAARGRAALEPVQTALKSVWWCFETDPTYDDLTLEMCAYFEVFGRWPEVVVIDNLMNLVPETDDEFGGMRDHTRAIKRLARHTGVGLFVLHHCKEDQADLTKPPAKKALQGRISQLPELILTMAWVGEQSELRVCPAKNRWGASDPSGSTWTALYCRPDSMQFYASKQAMEAGMPV